MKKIIILLSVLSIGCKTQNVMVQPTGLVANEAMVVSAREEASKIGVEIMKKGGNAFDAMVATELALAVAYPYAGNLGGGGFGGGGSFGGGSSGGFGGGFGGGGFSGGGAGGSW